MTILDSLLDYVRSYVTGILLLPGSRFFIGSLLAAMAIAVGHIIWRRLSRGRRLRWRTVLFALFPGKIWRHRSTRTDILMFLANSVLFAFLIGWAVVGYLAISNLVMGGLNTVFGPRSPTAMPEMLARSLVTLALFLAFELAYWTEHYLMHRIPFLWEFHKVHHSAEHLTPLTVARVHPVDSLVYAHVKAVILGLVSGVAAFALGGTVEEYTFSGTNVILVVFVHLYFHLQHSHIWIPFTGLAGKLFASPAHHQIHHSTNPRHFDKNMGGCLAIWDWAFGTLFMPSREPVKLTFGIDTRGRDVHEIGEALLGPLRDAAGHVVPRSKPARIEPAE